jgi:hypothetical protein
MTNRPVTRWLVRVIAEAVAQAYANVIRRDIAFCQHGYIAATCATCSRRTE